MGNFVRRPIVSDGLISCIDFGSPRSYTGTGTTVNDAINKTSIATLYNSPTLNSQGASSHFYFDGVNDFMRTSLIDSIKGISMFVYLTGVGQGWKYVLDLRLGLDQSWFTYTGNGTEWQALYVNGVSKAITPSSIPVNQWCHVYLQLKVASSAQISFFTRYNNQEYVEARLNGVQIYNRNLTVAEIQQNYEFLKGRFNL